MVFLSIREQDDQIRRMFPAFKLVFNCGWFGIWEGALRPICQTYKVRIQYFPRRFFKNFTLENSYETITILDPPIGPDPRGTGQPPQHVYRLGYPKAFPRLCVHDPQQDEWSPAKSIADVLIPMTIKWLIFHEDWVDTGTWRGGGRHPEVQGEIKCQEVNLSPEDRAQRARSLNAAFHRLGRKIGVFGSYPWTAGAYAGFSPPLCLESWNYVTETESGLANILTLSQVHRQAVLSHSGLVQVFQPPNFETSISSEARRFSQSEELPSQAA